MLKKSLIYLCALTAPCGYAAHDRDNDAHDEVIFPSKTYFMMAVDRHISNNIKPVDMSRIFGVPDISADDEQVIYQGIRKAILKDAAQKWDAGRANDYGRKIERVTNWQDEDIADGYELQNRIVLFRYALDSPKASDVLEQYEQVSTTVSDTRSMLSAIQTGKCDALALKSHFNFYQQLSAFQPMANKTLKLAKQFETLSSCQKFVVDTLLLSSEQSVTKDALLQTIRQVKQSSDPQFMTSLLAIN